jgi:hypothetical protein
MTEGMDQLTTPAYPTYLHRRSDVRYIWQPLGSMYRYLSSLVLITCTPATTTRDQFPCLCGTYGNSGLCIHLRFPVMDRNSSVRILACQLESEKIKSHGRWQRTAENPISISAICKVVWLRYCKCTTSLSTNGLVCHVA